MVSDRKALVNAYQNGASRWTYVVREEVPPTPSGKRVDYFWRHTQLVHFVKPFWNVCYACRCQPICSTLYRSTFLNWLISIVFVYFRIERKTVPRLILRLSKDTGVFKPWSQVAEVIWLHEVFMYFAALSIFFGYRTS